MWKHKTKQKLYRAAIFFGRGQTLVNFKSEGHSSAAALNNKPGLFVQEMASFAPHVAFLVQQMLPPVIMHLRACVCYIKNSPCHLSGSVPGIVPVRHTSLSPSSFARVSVCTCTRQTRRLPSLPSRDYGERVKKNNKKKNVHDSLGSARVLHLIVGVLDDSVEGGHQGLLQVEAAGVAGDLCVWQGLE